jgi:lactate dehydrogenase-like 2-hydroxyacid dehydrogenase
VILVVGKLPEVAARFAGSCVVLAPDRHGFADTVAQQGAGIRAIATRGSVRIDGALMDALPALEIIAGYGVGYDSIDALAAAARGIVVTNTPDVLNDEVADLSVGLLLATVRRLPQADHYVRSGQWLKGAFPLSPSLRGRRVGLVGMGRIGKAIAQRLAAFDVPLAYHSRHAQPGLPWAFYPDLEVLARESDVLIVIVPGGAETYHLIDSRILDALGPDGILINVARGSVVDEPALVLALQERRILAAGLDVFADEPRVPEALLTLDNVVLLPHVGSGTHHTRSRMSGLMLDNLASWLAGEGPLTPVAETPWPG